MLQKNLENTTIEIEKKKINAPPRDPWLRPWAILNFDPKFKVQADHFEISLIMYHTNGKRYKVRDKDKSLKGPFPLG